jgi:hypothetical protein
MKESEAAFFHNQKKGDFDPETGIVYETGTDKFEKYQELLEKEKITENLGNNSKVEKHIENLISRINSLEVNSLYKNDEEQIKLLKQRKLQSKNLIGDVLKKAEEYLETIRRMYNISIKKDEMEGYDYRKELENADMVRRNSHDALIADINIANRFISKNFGKISEEAIEEWEETEENAGRKVLHAKRIELPPNVICVDNVNLNDRKSITDWAIQISQSLSEMKKRLDV